MLQALFYEKNLSFLVKKCVFLLTKIRTYVMMKPWKGGNDIESSKAETAKEKQQQS